MIYRVVLDDTIDLHTSDINCMLLNPSLDLEMNSAGSFNFTLPPSHPYWDSIKVLKSTIDVYEDGDLIFTGRIASIEKNWNNERVVQCEGALAYFNDSIHRQMKWETPLPIASEDPTVHNFLKDILDNHNVFEGAENANRHIFIGNITVDPEVVTREVNYDTTLDILTRMCIDTNGGYMSVRKDLDDGKLYLDWIKDFTEESGQPAQFGLNLLNFDTSLAAEDICTGVLARGAEVNEQTVMLNNVELVDETTYPDMSVTHYTDKYQDILWHREGVAKFGQVVQVHDFSDAQTAWKDGQGQIVANSLFEMAKKWLEEKNTKIETIEVEVAELAWLGEGMPKYKLGQIVELSDNVHMAGESYETRLLPMYKLSCDLNSGSKKVTLGTPPKKELTQISASNSDSSTLSSSGSSSGSGGSGEGEECRVHDVKVNGTSVVTDKIANVAVPTDTVTQSQMTQAISTAIAPKANTADVNQALALKQDNLVFNSQDAATAHLTKIKNGNEVYDIPTGTEVEANPTGAATSDLTKLKVGSDIYGIPSGGTSVEANPSDPATDDLNTIKIGETVYDIPGGGSTTNYGKFKCDVLFNTPTTTSAWASPIEICSEEKAKEYDMIYLITKFVDGSSNGFISNSYLVNSIGHSSDNDWMMGIRSNSRWNNPEGFVFLSFDNSKLKFYTNTGNSSTLYKVYGLKFENKLINRSDIYSEEERMIGRWTDGKPLYQKVLTIPNLPNATSANYPHGIQNVDNIWVSDGVAKNTQTGSSCQLNNTASSNTYQWVTNVDRTNVSIWAGTDRRAFDYVKVILKYTKTTDTADSDVLPEDPMFISDPMIYSEEEQVVGSWTDGKPIYQKTFLNIAVQSGTSNVFTHNLGIDKYIDFSGRCCANGDGWSNAKPFPYYQINWGGYVDILGWDANSIAFNSKWNSSYVDITIRYTKVADSPLSGPKKGKIVQRSDIYSEEERLIGRWTDGKPLYQRTIVKDLTLSSSWQNYYDLTGIDLVNVEINKLMRDGEPIPLAFSNIGVGSWTKRDGYLKFCVQGSQASEGWVLKSATLQYTKSTDAPFSKQLIEDPQFVMMSDVYSEDEQVVGRWTDGKPLYQKTTILTGIYTGNMNNVDFGLGNKNIEALAFTQMIGWRSNDAFLPIPFYNPTSPNDGAGYVLNTDRNVTLRLGSITYSKLELTLRYTKTTDAPGTGPTKGNLIYLPALYSEEEREVGVWTDGRPLYQKSVIFNSLTQNNWNHAAHNVANIDKIVYCVGGVSTDDGQTNYYTTGANNAYNLLAGAATVNASIYVGNYPFKKAIVTFQYTKTTDQPGSGTWTPEGQLAHHYSTSEKVVGTWIDGSTVYERTWSGLSYSTSNNWTNFVTVPNGKNLIKVNFYGEFGTDLYEINAKESHIDSSTGILEAWFQLGSIRTIKVITLQYTKSS